MCICIHTHCPKEPDHAPLSQGRVSTPLLREQRDIVIATEEQMRWVYRLALALGWVSKVICSDDCIAECSDDLDADGCAAGK